MCSLNLPLFYEDYKLHCYESGYGPPIIDKQSRLLAAVVQNEVGVFRDLLDSSEWYNITDRSGLTLLQIAIVMNNKEVFDYMMSISDFPIDFVNEEGQTALIVALEGYIRDQVWTDQYFAYRLIETGVNLDVLSSEGNNPLQCALDRSYNEVAILLIEKGADVNTPDSEQCTPLKRAICMTKGVDEVVPALLIHGAIPSIDLFEFAVAQNLPFSLQEMLLMYLFDEYSKNEIGLHVILKLLETRSPLFHELLKCPLKVWVRRNNPFNPFPYFYILCSMDFDLLDVAIEKFGDYIRIALEESEYKYFRFELDANNFMKNLSCMLETEMRSDVISHITTIESFYLLQDLLRCGTTESDITKLYCYLLSYGLNIDERDFHLLYEHFEYCELFNILLHMDINMEVGDYAFLFRSVVTAMVYDVTLDLDKFFARQERYSTNSIKELLNYFVHPELRNLNLSIFSDDSEILESPEIPLLCELARNTFRKYFIQTFKIKTSRKFYTLLNCLPISTVHKEILSYKRKLY